MSDVPEKVVGKVRDNLKSKDKATQAIKVATDRFLSGGHQDALDILSALPPAAKQAVVDNPDGRRLVVRLGVQLNYGADPFQVIGLKPPQEWK